MADDNVDYCLLPSAAPPEGVIPNLVDPVNLSVETMAVGGVLTGLTVVFLIARLLSNWNKMKVPDCKWWFGGPMAKYGS